MTLAYDAPKGGDLQLTATEGHTEPSLGASDSSDSPSDLAGQELATDGDPVVPVDVATSLDGRGPATGVQATVGDSDSDAGGTGERRSAANDAGISDAADIAPDREFEDPAGGGLGMGMDEAEEATKEDPER